jgi:hypothetical protein
MKAPLLSLAVLIKINLLFALLSLPLWFLEKIPDDG